MRTLFSPGSPHFTLDTHLIKLNVKQGVISCHFLILRHESTGDWTPVSQGIGEVWPSVNFFQFFHPHPHSLFFSLSLSLFLFLSLSLYIYIYIYISIDVFVRFWITSVFVDKCFFRCIRTLAFNRNNYQLMYFCLSILASKIEANIFGILIFLFLENKI